jgi:ribosome modulation factor
MRRGVQQPDEGVVAGIEELVHARYIAMAQIGVKGRVYCHCDTKNLNRVREWIRDWREMLD